MKPKSYLADTHCLLWFLDDHPNLPRSVLAEMQEPDNDIVFSQISLFEIAIKQKIGKLPDFTAELDAIYHQALRAGFRFLPIQNAHLFGYHKIPLFEQHRDPFDRLLLASAYQENLILLSADNHFALYEQWVQVFWPQ